MLKECIIRSEGDVNMLSFSDKKSDYCLRILLDDEKINNIFKEEKYININYKYSLEIYMVNKEEEFFKIKKLSDIKNYAIISDDNGKRKVILNNNGIMQAEVHSIYLIHEILYNLGYYELFYVNKDVYEYKFNETTFKIIKVKNEGCFLSLNNATKSEFKELLNSFRNEEIQFDLSNNKIDIIQLLLDKALPKK